MTNPNLRVFLAGFAGALLMLFVFMPNTGGAAQEEVDQSAGIASHASGELLVVYETGTDAAVADELPEETNGEIEEELPEIKTQVIEFPEVQTESKEQNREELLQQKKTELENDPAVESVSYNFIYSGAYTPNDDRFEDQYGLQKIKAPRAWDKARGGDVDVAIVDTGVSNSHPDLRRKISTQANCINDSQSDLSCVEGRGRAEDDNGHGTQVAGVAAAITNNDEGIAGACPNCRLLIAKSLNSDNNGTASDVAGGIIWATDEGAEVINLSLGAEGADAGPVEKAIDRAQRRGALVVAAAGNYGRNSGIVYPAAYKNVVAVAATDRNNRRISSSSTGIWVDVAAPGSKILSTRRISRYGPATGTSFSSPLVAGVAGLLAGQGRSANDIRRKISSTAVDLGPKGKDKLYGHGLVDAAAAVGARNSRPRIQRPRPVPRSKVRDRTPNISAFVRDRETNLRRSNLTLILDGKKKTSFQYDTNRGRLSYTSNRKLASGKHSVKVVARDGERLKAVKQWTFTVKAQKSRRGPLSLIDEPGYPFNILPDNPIFDRVKEESRQPRR